MKIEKRGALRGEILIPADKSITHRAIILGSIGDGVVEVENYLAGEDCLSTLSCMEKLGVKIEQSGNSLLIHGAGLHGLKAPKKILDAGNSGTTLRLLMGLLAAQPFNSTFTGDNSLKKRPLRRVIDPLSKMGASFSSDKLPLTINGRILHGMTYETTLASAQVKSAILLAGLYASEPTQIKMPSCRDHTEIMLRASGVTLDGLTIYPAQSLRVPERIQIPNDISSAAYWIVLATLLDGSDIILRDIGVNQTRTGLTDALEKMGASIQLSNPRSSCGEFLADLRIKNSTLRAIELEGKEVPRLIDELPILAVAATFAEGTSIMRGVGELRVKESDRLSAIEQEINKLSPGTVEVDGDTLIIHGGNAKQFSSCKTYGDHRIAMSLGIMGMAASGVELDDIDCVNISYPNFFNS